ncbi:MAG: tyrosine recombinase XerC [Clostridia bacterium]|nr:tyrosine recombinase XerC [Clostridia bacterium]
MSEIKKKVKEDTSPVVERFLRYKLVIQGRSPKTVAEYRLDLHTFFVYQITLREGISPDSEEFKQISIKTVNNRFIQDITTLDILEFLVYMANDRGNSTASRARKLSAIKTFFKYMVATERILERNPAADIETPKKKNALPKYLTEKESISLLTAVLDDQESKYRERDYCIITLFLNCGMRLSELVGISLSDIDRDLRSLRVVGKGNKERIVYLNDACRDAIRKYLECRGQNQTDIKDPNALFLSRLGRRLSHKTVQWLVYKYLEQAGLEYKHFSTHKLRHTAATLMYQEGGVDVLALKEILGHSQLSTTQIYTHIGDKKLEEAISKNPLANINSGNIRSVKKDEN